MSSADSKEKEAAAYDPERPMADAASEQVINRFHEIMVEIDEVSSSDVLLDVSESATEHISGSLAISYEDFMEIKSPSQLRRLQKSLVRQESRRTTHWSSTESASPAAEGHPPQPMSTGL